MASRYGSGDGRPTGPLPAGTQRVTAGVEVPGGRFLHQYFPNVYNLIVFYILLWHVSVLY